jgi:hypothetical protein
LDSHHHHEYDDGDLSPARRLDLIADIFIRGLARALLAEEMSAGSDGTTTSQTLQTPALLNGVGDAVMASRDGERAGGRHQ